MPEPVPLTRVHELLVQEAGRRTLPREATLAQQHAEQFAKLSVDQTAKLLAALKELPFVDSTLVIKIADMLPQYPEEIRLLLAKERIVLDEAQITRLLEIVAQHR